MRSGHVRSRSVLDLRRGRLGVMHNRWRTEMLRRVYRGLRHVSRCRFLNVMGGRYFRRLGSDTLARHVGYVIMLGGRCRGRSRVGGRRSGES